MNHQMSTDAIFFIHSQNKEQKDVLQTSKSFFETSLTYPEQSMEKNVDDMVKLTSLNKEILKAVNWSKQKATSTTSA